MIRILIALSVLLLTAGCSTQYPNTTPVGKTFPKVTGQSLDKVTINMPQYFADRPVLLLLGYVQNTQFDIDRWLIGLDMTNTQVDAFELPTIAGMIPRFFETQINEGMRAGIPKDLWKGVITIYDDGKLLQQFTGNENPNNARVMLLDRKGQIIYFYDSGFSVQALNQLKALLQND